MFLLPIYFGQHLKFEQISFTFNFLLVSQINDKRKLQLSCKIGALWIRTHGRMMEGADDTLGCRRSPGQHLKLLDKWTDIGSSLSASMDTLIVPSNFHR